MIAEQRLPLEGATWRELTTGEVKSGVQLHAYLYGGKLRSINEETDVLSHGH